jgi:hypothetical protein
MKACIFLFYSVLIFFLSFVLPNVVPACLSFTIFSRNLLRIFNLYYYVVINFGEQLRTGRRLSFALRL